MSPITNWKTVVMAMVITSCSLGLACLRLSQVSELKTIQVEPSEPGKASMRSKKLTEAAALEWLDKFWQTSLLRPSELALTNMLEAVDKQLAQQLLQTCDTLSEPERRKVLRPWLFGRLTELDPATAVLFGEKLDFMEEGTAKTLSPLLSAWKNYDAIAAEAWYRKAKGSNVSPWLDGLFSTSDAKSRPPARPIPSSLSDAWAQSEALRAQPLPAQKLNAVQDEPIVAWATSNRAWESAYKHLSSSNLDEGDSRANWVLEAWGQGDYADFLGWLQSHPDAGGQQRGHLLSQAGYSWLTDIQRNPTTEIRKGFMDRWSILVQENPRSDSCLTSNLTGWVQEDPTAASTWLSTQSDKPWRDELADVLAQETIMYEPERAMAWAASIQQSELRDRSLIGCWIKWRYLEGDTADAWMKEHVPDFDAMQERVKKRNDNFQDR